MSDKFPIAKIDPKELLEICCAEEIPEEKKQACSLEKPDCKEFKENKAI
jgi:hypothetical protein